MLNSAILSAEIGIYKIKKGTCDFFCLVPIGGRSFLERKRAMESALFHTLMSSKKDLVADALQVIYLLHTQRPILFLFGRSYDVRTWY